MAKSKYKRILLKISGEGLCKPNGFGLDSSALESLAKRIIEIKKLGSQIAIVIGAGNFLRGESFSKTSHIPRNTADHMGMLATIINACAMQETLEGLGQPAVVLSAIKVDALCEKFVRRKAVDCLESGKIVMLAGGTGNPFFTTDTCAALRASELGADLIIKATKVDGVYSDDPKKNKNAEFFTKLSYEDILKKNLKVIDQSAITLARESNIPIVVLNIFKEDNIAKALNGEQVGTYISS